MTRFCQVATFVLAMSGMPIAQAPDELIARLQQKYEALESFSADFEQMFQGGGIQLRESGVVKMKKPGKMYWEYLQPTPKLFIADGKKSYFYVPQDNQVIVSDLDLDNASTPLLFLVGKGKIQEDFQIELEEAEKPLRDENILVRLTPKQPQGGYSHLMLEIDPSTYLIYRLIVIEPIGNRNEYIMKNIRENIRISDRQFRFKLPKDVEVLSQ